MTKVRNVATAPVSLVMKDGSAETVRPGEEKSVSFDPNNEHNRQMIAMGAIEEVEAGSRSSSNKGAAKRSSKAAPRSRSKGATKKAAKEAPASDEPSSGA